MATFARVYLLLSVIVLGFCSVGISQQIESNTSDSLRVDTAEVDTTMSDTAYVESIADTADVLSELKSSIEQLEERQEVLTGNITSIQSGITELNNQEAERSNFWLYFTIICLSILTLFSIGISFYLYRRQIVMVRNTGALVPEKWGGYLESVGKQLKKFGDAIGNKLGKVEEKIQNNTERIQSMIDTHMQLQDTLDEKDAEIKRLKNGYDSQIYRDFLYRFIRVDQTLSELLEEEEVTEDDLELIKRLMEDAFLECGVERFNPDVGEDYTSAKGVDENPEKIGTQEGEKEFQIAEIMEAGYELKRGEQAEVLVPAKVKIYVNEN